MSESLILGTNLPKINCLLNRVDNGYVARQKNFATYFLEEV